MSPVLIANCVGARLPCGKPAHRVETSKSRIKTVAIGVQCMIRAGSSKTWNDRVHACKIDSDNRHAQV